jgi:GAF domain-containing protein
MVCVPSPSTDAEARSGLLLRLARQVTGRQDLDDVLAEVFRTLRTVVAFGGGSIQLLDGEGWIQMAASEPAAPPDVKAQRVPLGSSVAGRVILTERPIYLPDIERGVSKTSGRRVSTGVRSYLGVPLVADGRAIGVLQIDSLEVDAWDSDQRDLLIGAAPVVAAAIQNARAHARADAARRAAATAERRLADARKLVAAARASARAGDRLELERQLARIEALLAGAPEKSPIPLPQQRMGAPAAPVVTASRSR